MRRMLAPTLAIVAGLLNACGALPDAKPFADATVALASSVDASGTAVADSLFDLSLTIPGNKAKYESIRSDFISAWSVRAEAMRAAVAYSEAIQSLIAAGKEGAETAGNVGDALQALATTVGIPVAAPVAGVAGDLARFVGERIAMVRASKSLEAAVTQAQPAVDRIAESIEHATRGQLKAILSDAYGNTRSGIQSSYDDDDSFAMQARKRRQEQRQATLRDPSMLSRLQDYDRVQASVAASLAERDRKLEQAAAAYKTRLQLINAMSSATKAWARAHRDLSAAIREKRRVSTVEIRETILTLRELTRKVEAL